MHAWLFRAASLFTALATLVFATTAAFADQTFRVEMGPGNAFAFRPTSFQVSVGERVTFDAPNVDTARPHDIRIEGPGGFAWELVEGNGNIAVGATGRGTTPVFTQPGEYQFWCPVGMHRQQGMVATFRVVAAGQATQLPRTGEPMTLLAGALAAAGALSLGAGVYLRRRAS